jgi:cell wall assembly regulator SMI1
MVTLQELFLEIDTHHLSEPCGNVSEIDALEKSLGYLLPHDMKDFYRRYQSVRLFDSGSGATYRFIPIDKIHPTRIDIYGEDTNEWGPSTWLSICDVMDGNYIAIDVASIIGDECNFIDCYHESFAEPGECEIIARSFTELLEHALRGQSDIVYYLQEGFTGYGDAIPKTPKNTLIRIDNPNAPKKTGL